MRITDEKTIMTKFGCVFPTLQNPEEFRDWGRNPLNPNELIYLYLEAVTPFRLLIQFALRLSDLMEFKGKIDKMSVDVTIAEVLNLTLDVASCDHMIIAPQPHVKFTAKDLEELGPPFQFTQNFVLAYDQSIGNRRRCGEK